MVIEEKLKEKYYYEMDSLENYMKKYPKDIDYGERYIVGFSDGYKVACNQMGCNVALWYRKSKRKPTGKHSCDHNKKMVKDFKKMSKAVRKFMQKYGNPLASVDAKPNDIEYTYGDIKFAYGETAESLDAID